MKENLTANRFYNRLSYSFGNEDPNTEHQALNIKPFDTVVCVTASGDRPLNLLTKECKKIFSVDCNPIQNHLLSLKMHAMSQLDFSDYIKFLGAEQERYPLVFYDSVIDTLKGESKSFWSNKTNILERGVLYEGSMEKLCFWIALVFNIFLKDDINKLFSCKNISEQTKLVDDIFAKKSIRFLGKIILNPKLNRYFFADPGLYAHVDKDISVYDHLIGLIKKSLSTHFVRENPLLNLIFLGKILKEAYPPYLQEQSVEKIKTQLEKVEIIDNDMVSFLKKLPDNSVDCFSLSDIASYMDYDQFQDMISLMVQKARPQARFCLRQLMSKHNIDKKWDEVILRNKLMEHELKSADRCFVYNFMTGTILKS